MTEQSTTEGQETPAVEAVLGPEEGNETRGNLEAENEGESFQNLESSEADSSANLASDAGLEAALDPQEGTKPLITFLQMERAE